jgi:hypothetical protein
LPSNQLDAVRADPSGGLTADEEARAAALEARIVAEERAADDARGKASQRAATAEAAGSPRSRGRESGMLAVRAADELVVVRRDLRRIMVIDGGLVIVLFALWAIASATGFLRF